MNSDDFPYVPITMVTVQTKFWNWRANYQLTELNGCMLAILPGMLSFLDLHILSSTCYVCVNVEMSLLIFEHDRPRNSLISFIKCSSILS